MSRKVHLPWTDRNPAEWVEDDIPTEGGLYGWDHAPGHADQPIPGDRRQPLSNPEVKRLKR